MSNKNNNSNFEIPRIIIFLAFVFCWPVGIILTILHSISHSSVNQSERHSSVHNDYVEVNNSRKNKKRISKLTKLFATLGIVFAPFAAYMILYIISHFMSVGTLDGEMCSVALFTSAVSASGFIAAKFSRKRDIRFAKLRTIIGNRESINLTKLASAVGDDLKSIRKDVQNLIDDGEFGDSAYIDFGTNNFMKYPFAEPDDPEAFDYRTVYGDLFKKDKKDKKKDKNSKKEEESFETKFEAKYDDPTTVEDSDNFEQIISEIRRLNDEIKDVEVSNRIYMIETHTKNIFEYVTDHPEAMPQIRTFMNYYLPTTLKLLESYSRIERVGVAGENMKKSKADIENILDLLSVGFEQQIDQLFKNEYIDISSDISVLEKMMQKDGLSGKNDLDIMSYVDDVSDEITDSGFAAMEMPEDKK